MTVATIDDVFAEQLADLRSAETQLVEALPKVAAAAHEEKLREAIEEHLQETRGHVERLDRIIGQLNRPVPTRECKGMKGLIAEGEEITAEQPAGPAKDAAIIGAAQRVEHYEIAAYGTAKALAGELGYGEARSLLDETLDEESAADELLTKIATGGLLRSGVNADAPTR